MRLPLKIFWHLMLWLFFSLNLVASEKTKLNPAIPNDDFGSRSFGHILTPNNRVLSKNEVALGTLYTVYGLTDNWTVGFSPFTLLTFSMENYASRWAWNVSKNERAGIEIGYFKTFGHEYEDDEFWTNYCRRSNRKTEYCNSYHKFKGRFYTFKMEAWSAKLTYNYKITPKYRLNISSGYYYYINDDRPFSLRMDPQNNDMYSLNFTSLHELKLHKNIYLNLEGGLVGLNYTYPYYHLGATFNYQRKIFSLAVGASSTFNPNFPREKTREFVGYDSTGSIHPEIQIEVLL